MSEKKWYKISLFVGICVLINYAGKIFAQNLQLPLFLDRLERWWRLCIRTVMWGNGRYDGQYHLWDPIFLDVHVLCCSQCYRCSDGRNMCKKRISEKSVWYAVYQLSNNNSVSSFISSV